MNSRRILIIGSAARGALEHAYADGFRAHGVDVQHFDPEAVLAPLRRSRVTNRLTWPLQHLPVGRALRERIDQAPAPDAVLVFKGYFLPAAEVRSARRKTGVPWINLNPDSPFDPGRSTSSRHIRAALNEYDIYLMWSRVLIERLMQAGVRRPVYLPFAADPGTHFPAQERDPLLADKVCFVGSYDSQRARVLGELADLPLVIYGNAWDDLPRSSPLRRCVRGSAIYGADLRRVVSSSLATINILRPQNAGSHNMRTFEAPAMGGVMLTTRSAEQQVFFPEGTASLMYDTPAELRALVQRLLRGDYDVAAIRAGALAAARGHDYRARARTIMAELGWPA